MLNPAHARPAQARPAQATIGRHPLDPDGPHRAAPVLGRLVAAGLLARHEALQSLLHALPTVPAARSGMQARLTHALDDAAQAHVFRRAATARAIRRAVAALLQRRAPRADLMRAAADADPDDDLLPRERSTLVKAEVARLLATRLA